ncbi:MAG: hypothetical protein RI564_11235, partial [Gracilimonas sp.]|nr:hypothetical protein [Gracilimonas sp.]
SPPACGSAWHKKQTSQIKHKNCPLGHPEETKDLHICESTSNHEDTSPPASGSPRPKKSINQIPVIKPATTSNPQLQYSMLNVQCSLFPTQRT